MVVLVALIYLNTPPRRRGAVPVGGSRVIVSRVLSVLGASGRRDLEVPEFAEFTSLSPTSSNTQQCGHRTSPKRAH